MIQTFLNYVIFRIKTTFWEKRFTLPFKQIFDLYEENEEIPDTLIEILLTDNKERSITLYGSSLFFAEFNNALKNGK